MPRPSQASAASAAWSLHGHKVEGTTILPLVEGVRIDLARPAAGLVTGRGDHLLGLDDRGGPRASVDAWVRGDDLTATWDGSDARDLRTTARWRQRDAGGGVAVWELIASATTARLRADSSLAVTFDIAADAILSAAWHDRSPGTFGARFAPSHGLVLVRRGDGTSCLVTIHPDDHQAATVERHGNRARIDCCLFPCGVEKGVLLRSRVLAAVGPSDGDLEWAARLAGSFAASPPELTT